MDSLTVNKKFMQLLKNEIKIMQNVNFNKKIKSFQIKHKNIVEFFEAS